MDIWRRIKTFAPSTRAQKERDLEREIRNHLDLEAEDSGYSSARKAFGNTTLVKEDVRAVWGWTRVEQFARDVRHGLRQVRRNPVFSAVAIATLALGIGMNTAMFSAVDAVLIRPLPYINAERLVMIWDNRSSCWELPRWRPSFRRAAHRASIRSSRCGMNSAPSNNYTQRRVLGSTREARRTISVPSCRFGPKVYICEIDFWAADRSNRPECFYLCSVHSIDV